MTDWINITTIISNAATVVAILLALWVGKKQLEDLKTTRHGDMVKAIFEIWNTPEMYQAYTFIQQLKFKNWNDFKKRNPPGSEGWRQWIKVMNFFNTVGVLVRTKALDIEVAHMMLKSLPRLWEKMLPLISGYRSEFESPHAAEEFEWVYNDMNNRKKTS